MIVRDKMNVAKNGYQSERELEESLLKQLEWDGYERVNISNEEELYRNLKTQIEKHNKRIYSQKEFDRLLSKISGKGVFESAKTLRDKQVIKDDKDKDLYIELFN